jgi:hypothetical protein
MAQDVEGLGAVRLGLCARVAGQHRVDHFVEGVGMSEIKTEIKANGDGSYTITDAHTTADVLRWLLTQDTKEAILSILNEEST